VILTGYLICTVLLAGGEDDQHGLRESAIESAPVSLGRFGLAVLALSAATCGGGSGRSVPLDDLAADLVNAECDSLVACGSVPDRATCLGSIRLDDAQFATMKADIAAGTVAYDGRAAGACIDVFKSLASCKQTAVGDIGRRLDATCGKVFTGLLPAGSACFFDDECADRGTCGNQVCSNHCCAGTCVARPAPIPLGGDCGNPLPNQDCIEGTICAANATGGGSCKTPLPAGARCGPYDRCALPYHCGGNINLDTGEGNCTAPPGQGQPCVNSDDCDDIRNACDPTTHVCISRVAGGGACATTDACVLYATCDGTTCVAMPGPDASCDPLATTPCLLTLSCDATMHCSLPPAEAACR
jgi:hypothetical protein